MTTPTTTANTRQVAGINRTKQPESRGKYHKGNTKYACGQNQTDGVKRRAKNQYTKLYGDDILSKINNTLRLLDGPAERPIYNRDEVYGVPHVKIGIPGKKGI
jgi:hypothetical protein